MKKLIVLLLAIALLACEKNDDENPEDVIAGYEEILLGNVWQFQKDVSLQTGNEITRVTPDKQTYFYFSSKNPQSYMTVYSSDSIQHIDKYFYETVCMFTNNEYVLSFLNFPSDVLTCKIEKLTENEMILIKYKVSGYEWTKENYRTHYTLTAIP